jgi:hypothetical protein
MAELARLDPQRFEAIDYHRNGVSGAPFYVGIYRDTDGTRKLITYFRSGDCAVAVLDLDKAAAGNVFMHAQRASRGAPAVPGTGGNAWRGDNYADVAEAMAEVWRERMEQW